MSVVIVGGHDKMSKEYIKVCKKYNCKAKVFTQMETGLKDKIGVCVDFNWEDFNEFKVIGNIYEHNHLLDNN